MAPLVSRLEFQVFKVEFEICQVKLSQDFERESVSKISSSPFCILFRTSSCAEREINRKMFF